MPKDTDICRNIRLEGFDKKVVNKTDLKNIQKEFICLGLNSNYATDIALSTHQLLGSVEST